MRLTTCITTKNDPEKLDSQQNSKVLSIMRAGAGNGIYADLLKENFSQSTSCHVDFYWSHDERKMVARVLWWLLSFRVPNEWIRKQNLDFHRSRSEIGDAYMAKDLAVRKLRQIEYSVLHFHTEVMAFLSIDLMKKLPTVVNVDMTSFQVYQEKNNPSFKWTYSPSFFLGKRCFEAAAQVVTWSEWARKSVIEDYNIDEKKVQAIYPGVNVTELTPPSNPKRDHQKLFNILFIGADFERKGGPDLLKVFLEKFAETAQLNLVTKVSIDCQHPNVHIHNNIKAYTPEWLELYHQSDVFVMPTYADAFGYVFLEAMAMGLPVIATRINAIPEIVSHGETGFLIQPGDRNELACSIQSLLENPTLCREMGSKGRKIAEQKFNIQKCCQTLESIFRKIVTVH